MSRGRMKENRLVEIPNADWQKLSELYSSNKTEPSGWNCLENYIHWMQMEQANDLIKIYSLNGDWSDGTFIIQDDNCVMFNTLDSNHDRLLLALDCLQSLEQFRRATYICICDFSHRYKGIISKYIEPTGVQIEATAAWFHIDQDKALNFHIEAPPETCLRSLNKSHAEIVNSLWPYRYPGSEDFVRRLIHFNISIGIFDDSGNIMGWCLQLPRGNLGLLHVRDAYKRKGYGSLMVRAMSKRLAEMSTEVTAAVIDSNVASREMLYKIGFEVIDTVHWVCVPMNNDGVSKNGK